MRLLPRIIATAAVLGPIAFMVACGGGGTTTPGSVATTRSPSSPAPAGSMTPRDALARAQQSLADGYTITVTAANFVLPNWGGSENGTVQVSVGGKTASAQLRRTGEDSSYAIRLVDDQTYFKRGTCDAWARVPGGGPDVLRPFLLAATNVLNTAHNPQFVKADTRVVVDATVDGLGRSLIQMEPGTYRLITIVFGDKPDNAGHTGFTFDFSELGKPLTVEKPSGNVPDSGPGGNPC
jgi:hypothetical protein